MRRRSEDRGRQGHRRAARVNGRVPVLPGTPGFSRAGGGAEATVEPDGIGEGRHLPRFRPAQARGPTP